MKGKLLFVVVNKKVWLCGSSIVGKQKKRWTMGVDGFNIDQVDEGEAAIQRCKQKSVVVWLLDRR